MIRLKELFRLENLKRLRLIAGQEGLERTVTAAVLLEYDSSRMELPDFYHGDLVVTTLALAQTAGRHPGHNIELRWLLQKLYGKQLTIDLGIGSAAMEFVTEQTRAYVTFIMP